MAMRASSSASALLLGDAGWAGSGLRVAKAFRTGGRFLGAAFAVFFGAAFFFAAGFFFATGLFFAAGFFFAADFLEADFDLAMFPSNRAISLPVRAGLTKRLRDA